MRAPHCACCPEDQLRAAEYHATVTSMVPIPPSPCRHLPKCFDNIHNLEFAKDAQGAPTKTAVGMYSGEGEYVPFAAPCSCDGPVEVRLSCVQGVWDDDAVLA